MAFSFASFFTNPWIYPLADRRSNKRHVPYRRSILSCRTLFIKAPPDMPGSDLRLPSLSNRPYPRTSGRFDVRGAAVLWPFQRCHRGRDRRICIRSRWRDNVSRGRVVSAAVIHVKHKSHIQDLCLKFCIFTILRHHQNIFRCGQFRFRRIDIEILSSA